MHTNGVFLDGLCVRVVYQPEYSPCSVTVTARAIVAPLKSHVYPRVYHDAPVRRPRVDLSFISQSVCIFVFWHDVAGVIPPQHAPPSLGLREAR